MSADWLTPVRAALDDGDSPLGIFFRNDDAGWDNGRLHTLLECFSELTMPIDLALIPQAVDHSLAEALLKRRQAAPALLGFHQHGFSHGNHETLGRKCEFGPSRDCAAQRLDLWTGKQTLASLFGPVMDRLFTPPWNRCTGITATCLLELGFKALSRDGTATPFNLDGLTEIPVAVDWCGIRGRAADPWAALGQSIASGLVEKDPNPLGIMLHHAVMDSSDIVHLRELLMLLAEHKRIDNKLMREFLETAEH